jgi:hypothetical protein
LDKVYFAQLSKTIRLLVKQWDDRFTSARILRDQIISNNVALDLELREVKGRSVYPRPYSDPDITPSLDEIQQHDSINGIVELRQELQRLREENLYLKDELGRSQFEISLLKREQKFFSSLGPSPTLRLGERPLEVDRLTKLVEALQRKLEARE